MDIKQALIERLQDHDISKAAKASIVEELKNRGIKVVRCVYEPKVLDGFRKLFSYGEEYIVIRETKTTAMVYCDGCERKFIKHQDELWEAGFTADVNRAVLVEGGAK